jgi:hypothetical protein
MEKLSNIGQRVNWIMWFILCRLGVRLGIAENMWRVG